MRGFRVLGALLMTGLAVSFSGVRFLGKSRAFALLDSLPPVCPVKTVLGLRCSFCGMTHAFLHLFFGEWREAIRENPLSIPVFGGLLFLAGGWVSGRLPAIPEERGRLLSWAAIGVLFLYALLRNLV
jgi:hypothetical protein